ncbi:MAG: PAS domain-containing protein, partial [Bacteroidota bacterium]
MPHNVPLLDDLTIVSEYVSHALAILDEKGEIIHINHAAERVLGFTTADLYRIPLTKLVSEKDNFALRRGIRQLQLGSSEIWLCVRMRSTHEGWIGPAVHWQVRNLIRDHHTFYIATGFAVPHLYATLARKGIPPRSIELNFEDWLAKDDLLAIVHPDGKLLHLHLGSVFGEIPDLKSIWELTPVSAHQTIRDKLTQEVSTGLSDRFLLEWAFNGTTYHSQTRIYPFKKNQKIIGWGFWAQIQPSVYQELRDLQMQVDETHEELAQFGVALSHDIRAPLRAILAFTENVLMENRPKLRAHSVEALQNVLDST